MALHCEGGNPWDVKKKKKVKQKKALKVGEEEEGDILENGDIRTKGTLWAVGHENNIAAPDTSCDMLLRSAERADGKVIKAASVSVQSNRTYEQEFALEMQKAQVQQLLFIPYMRCDESFRKVSRMAQSQGLAWPACVSAPAAPAGWEGEKYALGILLQEGS